MGNILTKKLMQAGRLVVGGTLVTGLVGGGMWLNSLSTAGTTTKNDFPALVTMVFDISGTGSTSAKAGLAYDAACFANPLAGRSGSGAIPHGRYNNISNPNGAAVQIGFVKSCGSKTTSGATLLASASSCTSSGCSTTLTADQVWNGADFIKVIITKDPTASFDGKVTLWYEDILGE